jgi:peroxiredoxin
MELITILNRCHRFRSFVYHHAHFSADKKSIEVAVRPRKGSAAVCSRCHLPAPGYDQLAERRFEFIPLWGFLVFLLYTMRRVNCRRCGIVAVEEVPWGDGKRTLTKAYMLFLARWARRLSWKETAEAFRTSWDKVFDAVEHVVTFGLTHRVLGQIDAIGVDEIQYAKGHRAKMKQYPLRNILLQRDGELSEAYRVTTTPSAVLITSAGQIGSMVAIGAQAITSLIDGVAGVDSGTALAVSRNGQNGNPSIQSSPSTGLQIGVTAPAIHLPDIDGNEVDLDAFKGKNMLLVFWNPNCGFCKSMLPELRRWEDQRTSDSLNLLIVSSGSVAANRAMGFRCPILLDQNFSAGRAFGATGTPSAVLVDSVGRIGSTVAIGSAKVLALASTQLPRALDSATA